MPPPRQPSLVHHWARRPVKRTCSCPALQGAACCGAGTGGRGRWASDLLTHVKFSKPAPLHQRGVNLFRPPAPTRNSAAATGHAVRPIDIASLNAVVAAIDPHPVDTVTCAAHAISAAALHCQMRSNAVKCACSQHAVRPHAVKCGQMRLQRLEHEPLSTKKMLRLGQAACYELIGAS